MENITRTVYGEKLQTALLTKIPYVVDEFSTLNEKFNIQAGILPPSDTPPGMRYFSIGNGGHALGAGASGIAKPRINQHRATDAALFNHLPFVMREPENDLSPAQRAQYALRREEIWNGTRYWAYYLKRLDYTGVTVNLQYMTVHEDGSITTTPFVPNSSNLNPVPPELTESGVNVTTGDYVRAVATINVVFSAEDVSELLNAANVIYNDSELAIISEIAYCSGVDKVVSVPGPGSSTINFNECIATQVCSYQGCFYPCAFSTNGFQIAIDVGANEPLFDLVQVP